MREDLQFKEIGRNGVGNPRSQVAQSMSYFGGLLYLGVTHPKGECPEDAARILRYRPDSRSWETVFQSDLVEADSHAIVRDIYRSENQGTLGKLHEDQSLVPRYRGYRCMTQFRRSARSKPVLYASTLSHWGSQLICSESGEDFQVVTEPGLGDPSVLSFRSILGFRNKLFVAPAGTVRDGVRDRMFGDIAKLHVSDDPLSGTWHDAIPLGFDDPTNRCVFAMCEFDDHLYAGTGNPERGFQLWKTRARGRPPFKWTRVISEGAYRYSLNEFTACMTVYDGSLYVGTGIPGLGYDRPNDVGPSAAELIRVSADDSWEVVVGSPRFTPAGFKVPLAAIGPGFDDPENSSVWAMSAYDGALYVGTHHCLAFKSAFAGDSFGVRGGFQIWATRNGVEWDALTLDGFGDPFATGVRTMLPTDDGLFVGTSTHREIEKVWGLRSGVRAKAGTGGLSVWLGY
jgi:hypothetical protein